MMENPEREILEGEIEDEDQWAVIDQYFKQHGLVSQQISSFDRFLKSSLQEVVKEHQVTLIKLENQYKPGK
jgi:DNA-directed RNA polymerase beta subunit